MQIASAPDRAPVHNWSGVDQNGPGDGANRRRGSAAVRAYLWGRRRTHDSVVDKAQWLPHAGPVGPREDPASDPHRLDWSKRLWRTIEAPSPRRRNISTDDRAHGVRSLHATGLPSMALAVRCTFAV